MKDLRHRFCDTLEARLIALDQAAEACRLSPNDAAFQALRDLCHRLAGVAASFGFEDLGQRARSIDIAISNGLATQRADRWTSEVLQEAEALMTAMESVLPKQHHAQSQKTTF